jgi:CelD/BcsL family acetyltransferase involved in cellulose biosynthesis
VKFTKTQIVRQFKLLKVREIREIEEFFELEPMWNKLLEKSNDDSLFLTWETVSAHVRHFGKEKKMRVLCLSENDKLIGLAPLRQSVYHFSKVLSYDVVEPLTYMKSDYTGFIFAEKEEDCLKAVITYLFAHKDWDFMYLFDFPETSSVLNMLPKLSKSFPHYELEEGKICPYISLPNSMDILLSRLSAKFRKNLRTSMKNLLRDYSRVELKRYDQFGSIQEAMEIFFELHQKRWATKNMPGVYSDSKTRTIYIETAQRYAEKGWLALYFLTANDKPIAAQYCLEYKQKVHYGLGGLDPDYSKYSVGNLITAKVLEKCIEKGVREYDFMKGDESYKFDWTTEFRRNMGIKFVNKKLSSKAYSWGIKTLKKMSLDKSIGEYLHY